MKSLRRWLKQSNTSQAAFAQEMGVTQAAVSYWVEGKNLPSMENVRLISEKTGISFDELLEREATAKRKKRSDTLAQI